MIPLEALIVPLLALSLPQQVVATQNLGHRARRRNSFNPTILQDPGQLAPAPGRMLISEFHHLALHVRAGAIRAALRFATLVHQGVAASLLPALSARVTPRYELAAPTWALRLAAHYDTPREILYSDDTVGGRFQAASADLVGCWTPGRRTLTGSLCAGLGGGGVFGIGVGVPSPRRPRAAWVGALASAGLRWAWSERWRLAVDASFTAGIRRPLFHIGDRETLFQSPQLGGAGTIGIERRLR